jgi:hypothetical protein
MGAKDVKFGADVNRKDAYTLLAGKKIQIWRICEKFEVF